jgi:hypothetical protein
MKANCYDCKFRGTVPGSAHSSCHHPLIEKLTEGDELPMLKLMSFFASVQRSPPQVANHHQLNIKGAEHGIASGWFNWPWNYDPLWLENCDGFEAKPKEEVKQPS